VIVELAGVAGWRQGWWRSYAVNGVRARLTRRYGLEPEELALPLGSLVRVDHEGCALGSMDGNGLG
jgi:hypothetical protein